MACDFPVRDQHVKFDILAIVLVSVTGVVVALRLFQKLKFERSLRLEDYLIVICFVSDPSLPLLLESAQVPNMSHQITCLGNTVSCVFGRE